MRVVRRMRRWLVLCPPIASHRSTDWRRDANVPRETAAPLPSGALGCRAAGLLPQGAAAALAWREQQQSLQTNWGLVQEEIQAAQVKEVVAVIVTNNVLQSSNHSSQARLVRHVNLRVDPSPIPQTTRHTSAIASVCVLISAVAPDRLDL